MLLKTLLKRLLPLLLLAVLTAGQAMFNGTCPQRQAMANFQLSMLDGQWYEQFSYPGVTLNTTCTKMRFSPEGVDGLKLFIEFVVIANGTRITDKGKIRLGKNQTVAEFTITEPALSPSGTPITIKFLHIDNSSCFLWTCCDVKVTSQLTVNLQIVYVMTRDKSPSAAIMNSNYKMARKLDVNMEKLTKCSDLTEFEENGQVRVF